jgi:nitrogen fixation NifU-like protein
MSDLRELYQEMILDHSQKPRNFHPLPKPDRKAEGYNPLCGDKFTIYLAVEKDLIKDVGFEGSGCAISKASASLMTQSVKGKTIEEARDIFHNFHNMLSGKPESSFNKEKLGKLTVFSGVSEFPVRVKCATLAWHTLRSALEENGKPVSTE